MRKELEAVVAAIRPVDYAGLEPAARAHLDNLTKPRGSLGRLEDLAVQLSCVQDGGRPCADPARIYTIAGDHGVAEEGVSLFPQEVTRQMVLNFLNGGAGINVLCATSGVQLFVVDAGCLGDDFGEHPALIRGKVAQGTANLAKGPAMTGDECLAALLLGVSLADRAAAEGVRVLGTGDMGIANTTPSTALYCAYLGLLAREMTGPGTGLAPDAVDRKIGVVERGLAANAGVVASADAFGILAALGGLEIACLAGLILGGAKNRQVVCVDGFISTAAYTAAAHICPDVRGYCVLSHSSAEPGHARAVAALGLKPVLDLGLRLGEGTGAAMTVFLLRCAADIFNNMASFADAGVSEG
ncbi:nicotinate-nucleotide--dimethylbenzimidazole phosphoribosyltransferase [Desulfovibrio aminophilus]|uniref:nicotinate-nucleotide--dimethylbenzimidazole phosphoribosyltransferase n=1 Tax=Desulfovibrio aminophilus TaxID=81425 RepID=UPI00339795B0